MDKSVGQRIKEIRNHKGLSLNKLSKKSGVSKAYLSVLESDTRGSKSPGIYIVFKIMKALDCCIYDLIPSETPILLSDFPEGLPQMYENYGGVFDVTIDDLETLSRISYQDKQPKTALSWLCLLIELRKSVIGD